MKRILKIIWTLEHPMGEIWFFILGSLGLLMLGVIDFDTAMSFIIPVSLFAFFIFFTSGLYHLCQKRKKRNNIKKK